MSSAAADEVKTCVYVCAAEACFHWEVCAYQYHTDQSPRQEQHAGNYTPCAVISHSH